MPNLLIGGLVAVGFDATGEYLLAVSHSGRGVYSTRTWERVARDTAPAYPERGVCIGIGPIDREAIQVVEIDFDNGVLRTRSPDQRFALDYEGGVLTVHAPDS